MKLEVVRPGLFSTLQDRGRRGYESLGISIGGALDDYAAVLCNRLAGNGPVPAVLEMTVQGPELRVEEGGVLAYAGADMGARVNGRPWSPGSAVRLRSHDVIRFGTARVGLRAYLATSGGFLGEEWLGSRSTDLLVGRGGISGRALRAGDRLDALPAAPGTGVCLAACSARIPAGPLRILAAEGSGQAPAMLVARVFHVAPRADRVGVRLSERVEALSSQAASRGAAGGTGLSEGMAMGSVELTPGGEVIMLLKSRGTVGGYFVPAHVIRADWPRLAQLRPGEAVRFALVSREEAQQAWATLRARLSAGLVAAGNGVPVVVLTEAAGRVERVVTVGTWLQAGERVADVRIGAGTVPLVAPEAGRVVSAAPPGTQLGVYDPVAWILGEDGGDEGSDR